MPAPSGSVPSGVQSGSAIAGSSGSLHGSAPRLRHPGAGLVPRNAIGWSENVLIALTGSGLHLDEWYTQTSTIAAYICTLSVYWLSYTVIWRTTPEICDSNACYWSYYTNITFTSNVEVGNSWINVHGKPCEYVPS
jgi:hypothetical protein